MKITDKMRLDFMQRELKGKVIIASADREAVISFHSEGGSLRKAIDAAIKAERRSR